LANKTGAGSLQIKAIHALINAIISIEDSAMTTLGLFFNRLIGVLAILYVLAHLIG